MSLISGVSNSSLKLLTYSLALLFQLPNIKDGYHHHYLSLVVLDLHHQSHDFFRLVFQKYYCQSLNVDFDLDYQILDISQVKIHTAIHKVTELNL